MRVFIAIAVLALSGCALVPNYIGPEVAHVSNITQHFGHDGCGWDKGCSGFNAIGGTAKWRIGEGGYLSVSEYYTPDKFDDRREAFEAQAGWLFQVRP